MRVLTIAPASTTIRLSTVEGGHAVATWALPATNSADDAHAIRMSLARWRRPDAVAVKLPHGGCRRGPALVDDAFFPQMERHVRQASPRQRRAVEVARVVRTLLPGVPVTASFDTSFHTSLPQHAGVSVPSQPWAAGDRTDAYGWHGLSCRHALNRAAELLQRDPYRLQMVCCHVGATVSVTSIRDGSGVDTSTRYLALSGSAAAASASSVGTGPEGLDGLSGTDFWRVGPDEMTGAGCDVRLLLARRDAGDQQSRATVAAWTHWLRREIAAATASLSRLDALVLTGSVAENEPRWLAELLHGIRLLEVRADIGRLAAETGDRIVSPAAAPTAVLVIASRDDLELARDAEALVAMAGARPHIPSPRPQPLPAPAAE